MDNKSLIEGATQDGLSAQTIDVLVNNLTPVTIAGAAGVSVDDLAGDEVTLYVRVVDATGSMQRFASVVIEACNDQLDALAESKASDSILMSTLFFNMKTTVLHSYLPLDKALQLDGANYQPDSNTALYDATLDAITSAVSYTQNLRDAGIRVKVVIVIVSDGEDNSSRHTAASVKSVVEDLINQEIYTLAFVAFGTYGSKIAASMGIPNVLDEQADAHSIRLALGTVSKSVIRASQTAGGAGSPTFFN